MLHQRRGITAAGTTPGAALFHAANRRRRAGAQGHRRQDLMKPSEVRERKITPLDIGPSVADCNRSSWLMDQPAQRDAHGVIEVGGGEESRVVGVGRRAVGERPSACPPIDRWRRSMTTASLSSVRASATIRLSFAASCGDCVENKIADANVQFDDLRSV
jgi:hypothetical protein